MHITLWRWKDISPTSTVTSLGSPVVQNLEGSKEEEKSTLDVFKYKISVRRFETYISTAMVPLASQLTNSDAKGDCIHESCRVWVSLDTSNFAIKSCVHHSMQRLRWYPHLEKKIKTNPNLLPTKYYMMVTPSSVMIHDCYTVLCND